MAKTYYSLRSPFSGDCRQLAQNLAAAGSWPAMLSAHREIHHDSAIWLTVRWAVSHLSDQASCSGIYAHYAHALCSWTFKCSADYKCLDPRALPGHILIHAKKCALEASWLQHCRASLLPLFNWTACVGNHYLVQSKASSVLISWRDLLVAVVMYSDSGDAVLNSLLWDLCCGCEAD
jgi:hypothetical protein